MRDHKVSFLVNFTVTLFILRFLFVILVILPHIGSADVAARNAMAVLAARNLVTGLLGYKMPAQVLL